MTLPTVPTAVLGAVEPSEIGTASGINNMMQRFGPVLGIAIVSVVSVVFAAYGSLHSPASVTEMGLRTGGRRGRGLRVARRLRRALYQRTPSPLPNQRLP